MKSILEICNILEPLITACYNEPEKAKVTKVIDETISKLITRERSKAEEEKKQMGDYVIRMSNALEHECGRDGDKGTKQWMAFKGFRNNIRDKYHL